MNKLSIEQLRAEFSKTFSIPPPRQASLEFLSGNLAYHQQCRQHGGLPPKLHRQLLALAKDASARPNTRIPRTKPGTTLIRMWKGEPHEVTVTGPKNYLYRGESYPSLTSIANLVTGSSWNGHTFFGLKQRGERA
jgi:hypothetical protein